MLSCSAYSRRNGWVIQSLNKSDLRLVIHDISKFKAFGLLLRCSNWSSDTKKQSKVVLLSHLSN